MSGAVIGGPKPLHEEGEDFIRSKLTEWLPRGAVYMTDTAVNWTEDVLEVRAYRLYELIGCESFRDYCEGYLSVPEAFIDAVQHGRELLLRQGAVTDDVIRPPSAGKSGHRPVTKDTDTGTVTDSAPGSSTARHQQTLAVTADHRAGGVTDDSLGGRNFRPPTTRAVTRRAGDRQARTDAKVCADCGASIGETVYLRWRRSTRTGYWLVPVCEACWMATPNHDQRENLRGRHPCPTCQRMIVMESPGLQWYCSDVCKSEAAHQRREQTRLLTVSRACPVCGATFTPPRADAKFCSAACKQKAYRTRRLEAPR